MFFSIPNQIVLTKKNNYETEYVNALKQKTLQSALGGFQYSDHFTLLPFRTRAGRTTTECACDIVHHNTQIYNFFLRSQVSANFF